jgi:ABC-type sugar transport system substrate-binding protein
MRMRQITTAVVGVALAAGALLGGTATATASSLDDVSKQQCRDGGGVVKQYQNPFWERSYCSGGIYDGENIYYGEG